MLGSIVLENGETYTLDDDGKWQGESSEFADCLQSFYDPAKPQGMYVTMPFGLGALFEAGNELHAKVNSEINVPRDPRDEGTANFDLADAIKNTELNPSLAKVKAGNFKTGKFSWQGLRIAIENPKGSIRRTKSGRERKMNGGHYGYFLGQDEAMDGDALDVFVGPNLDSDKVFIIDQTKKDSDERDEFKVMIGFDSEEQAKQAYFDSYEPGFAEKIFDDIEEMSVEQFKLWVKTADFSWSK